MKPSRALTLFVCASIVLFVIIEAVMGQGLTRMALAVFTGMGVGFLGFVAWFADRTDRRLKKLEEQSSSQRAPA